MSEDDARLGKQIGLSAKAIRKGRGLTLQDVADRSGLAKSYVWEIERGEKTNPSISALVSLTVALGCSLDDLVGAKKFMEPTLRPEAMRIAVQVDELLRAALASKHKDYLNENNEVVRVFVPNHQATGR